MTMNFLFPSQETNQINPQFIMIGDPTINRNRTMSSTSRERTGLQNRRRSTTISARYQQRKNRP